MTSEHSALAIANARPGFWSSHRDVLVGVAEAAASLVLVTVWWLSGFNTLAGVAASLALLLLNWWLWGAAISFVHWKAWQDVGEPWGGEDETAQKQAFAMPNSRARFCVAGMALISAVNLALAWLWFDTLWSSDPINFAAGTILIILAASLATGAAELWHISVGLGPGRRYVWVPGSRHRSLIIAGFLAAAVATVALFATVGPLDEGSYFVVWFGGPVLRHRRHRRQNRPA